MRINTLLLFFIFQIGFSQNPVQFYQSLPATGTAFGSRVDVYNDEVLVSSETYTLMEPISLGKVFLYRFDGGFHQTQTFYPDDGFVGDGFGSSLSIANDFIAIGAPNHGVGIDNTGVVYLYHKVGGEYQLMQQLSANELAFNQSFGDHVKIHENFLFISDRNLVYVYKYDGSQWVFSERLVIDAQEINAVIKIEAENNVIVFLNGYNLLQVYNRVGDNFVFDETIMAGDLEHYAVDFSLSNGELFVLTSGFPDNSPILFVYKQAFDSWYNFGGFNAGYQDQIYTKLKVSDGKVFLGSTQYILQLSRKFPVLYYKWENDNLVFQDRYYGTGPFEDDYFGAALACHGNKLIIGAPRDGGPVINGRAYYLDMTLATNRFEKQESVIYPNPASDVVFIDTDAEILKTEVYNIAGNLLLVQTGNNKQVSLENFATGAYFVKVSFKNKTEETFKIIKN